MNDEIHRLPDGSGFWVQEIGERPPGLISRLKYKKGGQARRYLYCYRNYKTARDTGLSRYKSLRWAFSVSL